jgi:hypothetical protein
MAVRNRTVERQQEVERQLLVRRLGWIGLVVDGCVLAAGHAFVN